LTSVLVSIVGTVLIARALGPALYADYALLMATITWGLLLAEAGGNVGFMRYLKDAEGASARASLYLALLRYRWLAGSLVLAVFLVGGPSWAHWASLSRSTWSYGVFAAVGLVVCASLTGQLSYYGLLGTFRHARALAVQQVVAIVRMLAVLLIAWFIPNIAVLAFALVGIAIVEAAWQHAPLAPDNIPDSGVLPQGLVHRSLRHGLVSLFDKMTSAIGSGPFLLIVLPAFYGRLDLALLAIASDLVLKALVLTSLPVGNMIMPYLNQALGDDKTFAQSSGRVLKVSFLLFLFSLGATSVAIPSGLPLVFGEAYAGATSLALLIVAPVFFDAWARFSLSSTLVTKGHYKDMVVIGGTQALLALGVLWLTYDKGLIPPRFWPTGRICSDCFVSRSSHAVW
jgi:O-antigen/teichoic acid export membrane protein